MLRSCLVFLVISFSSTQAVVADLELFEVPFQVADGSTLAGISFDFKIGGVDSTDAFLGSYGPGTLGTVSDPSLTGNASGVLTMSFDVPTPILQFGVALNTATPLLPGYSVELFDVSNTSIGVYDVNVLPSAGSMTFSEGLFSYTGVPVSAAIVDFAAGPTSFALDNVVSAVPEPSPAIAFSVLLAAACSLRAIRYFCSLERR